MFTWKALQTTLVLPKQSLDLIVSKAGGTKKRTIIKFKTSGIPGTTTILKA
jgi:hypothetical protein